MPALQHESRLAEVEDRNEYLNRFNLRDLVEGWLDRVAGERPADPFQFLIDEAMEQRESGGGLVTCANPWCGMTMPAAQLGTHLLSCNQEENWVRCIRCSERVEVAKLSQHHLHCRIERCPYCGEMVLPRMLMLCPYRLVQEAERDLQASRYLLERQQRVVNRARRCSSVSSLRSSSTAGDITGMQTTEQVTRSTEVSSSARRPLSVNGDNSDGTEEDHFALDSKYPSLLLTTDTLLEHSGDSSIRTSEAEEAHPIPDTTTTTAADTPPPPAALQSTGPRQVLRHQSILARHASSEAATAPRRHSTQAAPTPFIAVAASTSEGGLRGGGSNDSCRPTPGVHVPGTVCPSDGDTTSAVEAKPSRKNSSAAASYFGSSKVDLTTTATAAAGDRTRAVSTKASVLHKLMKERKSGASRLPTGADAVEAAGAEAPKDSAGLEKKTGTTKRAMGALERHGGGPHAGKGSFHARTKGGKSRLAGKDKQKEEEKDEEDDEEGEEEPGEYSPKVAAALASYPSDLDQRLSLVQRLWRNCLLIQKFREAVFVKVWESLDAAMESKGVVGQGTTKGSSGLQPVSSVEAATRLGWTAQVKISQTGDGAATATHPSAQPEVSTAAAAAGEEKDEGVDVFEHADEATGAYMTATSLDKLLSACASHRVLRIGTVLAVIRAATAILRTKRKEVVQRLSISAPGDMAIFGDLHGQMKDFLHAVRVMGHHPSATRHFLFNGDFIDRGPYGCEVIVGIFALLCAYPNFVFLNRGNHEDFRTNTEYGFMAELYAKYGNQAPLIHELLVNSFQAMPLVTILDKRVMVVHGGVPREPCTLDEIEAIGHVRDIPVVEQKTASDRLLTDLLWNDPVEKYRSRQLGMRHQGQGWRSSKRGCGVEYLSVVTDAFLRKNKLQFVIRSHDVMASGFEIIHSGKSITVFSASNYGGVTGNRGAVAILAKEIKRPVFHTWFLKEEIEEGIDPMQQQQQQSSLASRRRRGSVSGQQQQQQQQQQQREGDAESSLYGSTPTSQIIANGKSKHHTHGHNAMKNVFHDPLIGNDEFIQAFYGECVWALHSESDTEDESDTEGGEGVPAGSDAGGTLTDVPAVPPLPPRLPNPTEGDAATKVIDGNSTGAAERAKNEFMDIVSSTRSNDDVTILLQLRTVQGIRELIFLNRYALLTAFNAADKDHTGIVYKVEWCVIMRTVLALDLPWYYLCQYFTPRMEVDGIACVEYVRFLYHFDAVFASDYRPAWQKQMVQRIFEPLDLPEDIVRAFCMDFGAAETMSGGGVGKSMGSQVSSNEAASGIQNTSELASATVNGGSSVASPSDGKSRLGSSAESVASAAVDGAGHATKRQCSSTDGNGGSPSPSIGRPSIAGASCSSYPALWHDVLVDFKTFATQIRSISPTAAALEDYELYSLFRVMDMNCTGHVLLGTFVDRVVCMLDDMPGSEQEEVELLSGDELDFSMVSSTAVASPAPPGLSGGKAASSPMTSSSFSDAPLAMDNNNSNRLRDGATAADGGGEGGHERDEARRIPQGSSQRGGDGGPQLKSRAKLFDSSLEESSGSSSSDTERSTGKKEGSEQQQQAMPVKRTGNLLSKMLLARGRPNADGFVNSATPGDGRKLLRHPSDSSGSASTVSHDRENAGGEEEDGGAARCARDADGQGGATNRTEENGGAESNANTITAGAVGIAPLPPDPMTQPANRSQDTAPVLSPQADASCASTETAPWLPSTDDSHATLSALASHSHHSGEAQGGPRGLTTRPTSGAGATPQDEASSPPSQRSFLSISSANGGASMASTRRRSSGIEKENKGSSAAEYGNGLLCSPRIIITSTTNGDGGGSETVKDIPVSSPSPSSSVLPTTTDPLSTVPHTGAGSRSPSDSNRHTDNGGDGGDSEGSERDANGEEGGTGRQGLGRASRHGLLKPAVHPATVTATGDSQVPLLLPTGQAIPNRGGIISPPILSHHPSASARSSISSRNVLGSLLSSSGDGAAASAGLDAQGNATGSAKELPWVYPALVHLQALLLGGNPRARLTSIFRALNQRKDGRLSAPEFASLVSFLNHHLERPLTTEQGALLFTIVREDAYAHLQSIQNSHNAKTPSTTRAMASNGRGLLSPSYSSGGGPAVGRPRIDMDEPRMAEEKRVGTPFILLKEFIAFFTISTVNFEAATTNASVVAQSNENFGNTSFLPVDANGIILSSSAAATPNITNVGLTNLVISSPTPPSIYLPTHNTIITAYGGAGQPVIPGGGGGSGKQLQLSPPWRGSGALPSPNPPAFPAASNSPEDRPHSTHSRRPSTQNRSVSVFCPSPRRMSPGTTLSSTRSSGTLTPQQQQQQYPQQPLSLVKALAALQAHLGPEATLSDALALCSASPSFALPLAHSPNTSARTSAAAVPIQLLRLGGSTTPSLSVGTVPLTVLPSRSSGSPAGTTVNSGSSRGTGAVSGCVDGGGVGAAAAAAARAATVPPEDSSANHKAPLSREGDAKASLSFDTTSESPAVQVDQLSFAAVVGVTPTSTSTSPTRSGGQPSHSQPRMLPIPPPPPTSPHGGRSGSGNSNTVTDGVMFANELPGIAVAAGGGYPPPGHALAVAAPELASMSTLSFAGHSGGGPRSAGSSFSSLSVGNRPYLLNRPVDRRITINCAPFVSVYPHPVAMPGASGSGSGGGDHGGHSLGSLRSRRGTAAAAVDDAGGTGPATHSTAAPPLPPTLPASDGELSTTRLTSVRSTNADSNNSNSSTRARLPSRAAASVAVAAAAAGKARRTPPPPTGHPAQAVTGSIHRPGTSPNTSLTRKSGAGREGMAVMQPPKPPSQTSGGQGARAAAAARQDDVKKRAGSLVPPTSTSTTATAKPPALQTITTAATKMAKAVAVAAPAPMPTPSTVANEAGGGLPLVPLPQHQRKKQKESGGDPPPPSPAREFSVEVVAAHSQTPLADQLDSSGATLVSITSNGSTSSKSPMSSSVLPSTAAGQQRKRKGNHGATARKRSVREKPLPTTTTTTTTATATSMNKSHSPYSTATGAKKPSSFVRRKHQTPSHPACRQRSPEPFASPLAMILGESGSAARDAERSGEGSSSCSEEQTPSPVHSRRSTGGGHSGGGSIGSSTAATEVFPDTSLMDRADPAPSFLESPRTEADTSSLHHRTGDSGSSSAAPQQQQQPQQPSPTLTAVPPRSSGRCKKASDIATAAAFARTVADSGPSNTSVPRGRLATPHLPHAAAGPPPPPLSTREGHASNSDATTITPSHQHHHLPRAKS